MNFDVTKLEERVAPCVADLLGTLPVLPSAGDLHLGDLLSGDASGGGTLGGNLDLGNLLSCDDGSASGQGSGSLLGDIDLGGALDGGGSGGGTIGGDLLGDLDPAVQIVQPLNANVAGIDINTDLHGVASAHEIDVSAVVDVDGGDCLNLNSSPRVLVDPGL